MMKLKFLGTKNYAKGSLIVEAYSFERWLPNQEKELEDQKAHHMMALYPGMFKVVESSPKARVAPENKQLFSEQVK